MATILLVTWAGGGNVDPALGIATELTRRGHVVNVLGHAIQRAPIEAAQFAFQAFTHAPEWPPQQASPPTSVITRVFTDRGIGQDMLAAVQERRPDLVVIDCLLFGALRAAQRAGIPHATLVHTLYSQQTHQWSHGVPAVLTRLRGLRVVDLWHRSDMVVVTTLPAIDQCEQAPDNVKFTGPVWPDLKPQPATPAAGEPLILVSLSTTTQAGQPQAMQTILDAVADLPVRVLVTTGPSMDPHLFRTPANATIERFVPHSHIMPQASLVVGHGGHGTTMLALAHDLPLVILPMFELADQPIVGRTVERLGAACVLRKTASASRIRAAVEQFLPEGPHRAAARTLGAQLRQRDGAKEGADILEQMLSRSPVFA